MTGRRRKLVKLSTDLDRGRPVTENGAFGRRLKGSNWLWRSIDVREDSSTCFARCVIDSNDSKSLTAPSFSPPLIKFENG